MTDKIWSIRALFDGSYRPPERDRLSGRATTRCRLAAPPLAARLLLAAPLLLGSCLGGVRDRPLGDRCSADSDCEESLICLYGRCRSACTFDRDCPEGLACVGSPDDPLIRACVLPDERGCSDDPSVCPEGMRCGRDDVCREACEPDDDCGDDRLCDPVTGTCVEAPEWDVQAVLDRADFAAYPLEILGSVVEVGAWAQARFDGTSDDTYREEHHYHCDYSGVDDDAPETWDIERELIDPETYMIRVRGRSEADCELGQPVCSGEIQLNDASLWHIAEVASCVVGEDSLSSNGVEIDTWCDVDMDAGTVSWQSGSTCIGCCSCSDGALVNIEVVVSIR